MGKIRWTTAAVYDLQAIREYAADSSPAYANSLVDRLIARTDVLETFPESGRIVPEMQNPKVRELLERGYRIVYKLVDAAHIDIIRVHHSSRPLTGL
ncbi:MAG: type II toxin-antitoxin system RelE/ParE family toxin [Hymenobacter sp.]|nr:type II toxin-antitoxin system RelE/ParE family toxin [Hymenobacter sp.]